MEGVGMGRPKGKRTRLSARYKRFAEDLATSTDRTGEIMARHEIPSSTYYGRLLKNPLFLEYLQEQHRLFESEIRHVPFTSKRRRLEERYKLYQNIPDEGEEHWSNGMLKRRISNIPEKEKILNDIEREMEGQRFSFGPTGSTDELDLAERRRRADADLEVFEKDLEREQGEAQQDAAGE